MSHLTLVPSRTLDDPQMETLYARHGQPVFLQETFLRAWRTPELMDSESARGWLTTVARNLVIDRLRHRGRRPQESGDDALPQVAEPTCAIDQVVTSMTVRAALARLTPSQREILVEMYFRQRSLVEAADTLGIPVGTVKSRAHYALRALRRELEPAIAVAA